MKAGTANAEEAVAGEATNYFIYKLSISYKEASEALYWLRLLSDAGIIESKLSKYFLNDIEELKKILSSIIKNTKAKRN